MCLIWPDIFTLLLLGLWQYWSHKSFGSITVAIFSFGVWNIWECCSRWEATFFTILFIHLSSKLNTLFIKSHWGNYEALVSIMDNSLGYNPKENVLTCWYNNFFIFIIRERSGCHMHCASTARLLLSRGHGSPPNMKDETMTLHLIRPRHLCQHQNNT